ncbi:MAG: 2-oxo acid dehydrogenase subunit E2 [Flavobacteriaceae bacterium]|nr:MAG: 2-oxo acid dehydrogenase subunit E2 [Flavobacteriaceae bacterium]
MARFELKLPRMGESVAEATITNWLKEVGDTVALDEAVVEIATDKVDSEVPSEVAGKLIEILLDKEAVVKVGQTMAVIDTEGEDAVEVTSVEKEAITEEVKEIEKMVAAAKESTRLQVMKTSESGKFFSPLVRNIALAEGISMQELETISGTGKEGRVTKKDILAHIKNRTITPPAAVKEDIQPLQANQTEPVRVVSDTEETTFEAAPLTVNTEDETIAMSRMGKLIAKHMVASVQTSVHVQSFIEIDVTRIVKWKNKVKNAFLEREGEKLTFTPILMQAVASTIKKFPMINIAVQGDTIIKKKSIHLGMATALPDGNLIVPVIKNADQLNLVGMTKQVNDLAHRARNNQLKPDEIQGGTYTVTNVGSFGSVMGTPIINQPQVAILALGAIRKMPAVIETSEGDFIGIRQKMFVSHSYDHRVVNGALGGMFIKTLKDTLEAWDVDRSLYN